MFLLNDPLKTVTSPSYDWDVVKRQIVIGIIQGNIEARNPIHNCVVYAHSLGHTDMDGAYFRPIWRDLELDEAEVLALSPDDEVNETPTLVDARAAASFLVDATDNQVRNYLDALKDRGAWPAEEEA